MKVSRKLLIILAIALLSFAIGPVVAEAAEDTVPVPSPTDPDGGEVTEAMTEIINAYDTAAGNRVLPSDPGDLAVRWTNLVGGDTTFSAAPETISDAVDTGWDISDIADEDSSTIDQGTEGSIFDLVEYSDDSTDEPESTIDTAAITSSDSVVRALQVANMSNNHVDITYSALHEIYDEEIDQTEPGEFTVELFYEDGKRVAGDFDPDVVNSLEADGDDIASWQMGEIKTIYMIVSSDGQTSDGDWVESRFQVTNNAPVHNDGASESGDSWERGQPVETDLYDTQTGWFVTAIEGPVLSITKRLEPGTYEETWQTRPGDTIGYQLAVGNQGSDTATDVTIVDAIPENTTFNTGSADGEEKITDNLTISYEHSYDGDSFEDGDSENVKKIQWHYEELEFNEGLEVGNWDDSQDGERILEFSVIIN